MIPIIFGKSFFLLLRIREYDLKGNQLKWRVFRLVHHLDDEIEQVVNVRRKIVAIEN